MEQTLGKRIMQNRKRLGLTQDQLAEQLGVTAQAVSKWENDQSCPDITVIPKLADIFSMTTDELLGREKAAPVFQGEVVGHENADKTGRNMEVTFNGGRKASLEFAIEVIAVGFVYLLVAWRGWDISFWTVLWTTFLTVFGLFGLYPKFSFFRLVCALVGLYSLLSQIFPMQLSLSRGIIIAGVILIFGISLLVEALKYSRRPFVSVSYTDADGKRHTQKKKAEYAVSSDSFDFSASFGSNRHLVELDTLRTGDVSCCFGEFTVDLSAVGNLAEGAVVNTECNFGELTVLVPHRFRVIPESDTTFASFDVQGMADPDPQGVLRLNCEVNFGQTVIRYI